MIDLAHARCEHPDCSKHPGFGFDKPTHCKQHAGDEMTNLVSRRCEYPGCMTQPVFGVDKQTHCKQHADDDMTDLVNERCAHDWCDTRVNRSYVPYCARCHFYLNPDDPRIRNFKTREHAFMIPISHSFDSMILDKIINGGCSRRRPDGFLDLGSHVIIVEIDEDQHQSYDQTCDNRRMMELSQDLGHRPIVFIRVNPDKYIDKNKTKRSSAFKKSGQELKPIKRELETRLEATIGMINRYHECIPERMITIEQLYFDGY
jgi:hypothetical protein